MQPPRQPPGQPTAELQRQHVRPEEVWPQPVAWWCAMGGVPALRRKWGLGSKAVGPARPAHAMSSNATGIHFTCTEAIAPRMTVNDHFTLGERA